MSQPAALSNLADLLAALPPAAVVPTPPGVACPTPAAASFAALLQDARLQVDEQPPAQPPASDAGEDVPRRADPKAPPEPAAPLVDPAALVQVAQPPEAPAPAAPDPGKPAAEPRAQAPKASGATDSAPLLAASLVNLVLGTSAGAQPPKPAPGAADAAAPRAQAEPARDAHARSSAPAAAPHGPAPRAPDFPPLDASSAREADPAPLPQPDSPGAPALRPEAADAQAPASSATAPADPLAHHAAASDPTAGATQANASAPNAAPAAAALAATRDPGTTVQAARALPELPARGEVEVVRSVRVLADQGGGRVHIRLDPPELGGLSLRVVVSDGAVHVSMLADQPPVADLLQRHSLELRSALENHGLRLDQLDVGTGQPDAGARDFQPREPDERAGSGSRGLGRRIDPIALPTRRYDVSTLGVLDLHV